MCCGAKEVVAVDVIIGILLALVWTIGGLILCVLLAMCTPIYVSGRIDDLHLSELDGSDLNAATWRTEASWLLGLLHVRAVGTLARAPSVHVRLFGVTKPISTGSTRRRRAGVKRRKGNAERTGPKKKTKARRNRDRITLARVRELLPEMRLLMSRMWRVMRLRGHGRITFGFPDPFVTGMAHAVLAGVPNRSKLVFIPDYSEGKLVGWAEVSMKLYPIESLLVLLRTAFRPAVRRLWWPELRSALRLSKAH